MLAAVYNMRTILHYVAWVGGLFDLNQYRTHDGSCTDEANCYGGSSSQVHQWSQSEARRYKVVRFFLEMSNRPYKQRQRDERLLNSALDPITYS